MKNKNFIFTIMLSFSGGLLFSHNTEITESQSTAKKIYNRYIATVLTGGIVGTFTGTSLGYISGKIFDTTISQAIRIYFGDDYYNTLEGPLNIVGRITTKLLCTTLLKTPIQKKIMNRVNTDLAQYNITYDPEIAQLITSIMTYVGCVTA